VTQQVQDRLEAPARTSLKPMVSVIVNCFNGERYLKEAIDSVYAQTFADWEIVFWDNASTDRSAKIATSYDARVRYYRASETTSLGQARNQAIGAARGDFIAFLDCDDLWLPDKLERQLALFTRPRVGIVFSDVLCFNHRGYARAKYGRNAPPEGRVFEAVLRNNYLCMSSVVVRASVFRDGGLWFDPSFSAIEDRDLFVRIARDWELAYVSAVLCKYRMHEQSTSFSIPSLFLEEEERLIRKYLELYPEFRERYEARCREQLERDRAVVRWRQGDRKVARARMRPLLCRGRSHTLTYLAMFFPYHVVHSFRTFLSDRATSNY
jgi:glycosyltransferase involved in cell wall biosynthesis